MIILYILISFNLLAQINDDALSYKKAKNEYNNQLYSAALQTLQHVNSSSLPELIEMKILTFLACHDFNSALSLYLSTTTTPDAEFSHHTPQWRAYLVKYALKEQKVDDFFSLILEDPLFFDQTTRIKNFILSMIHLKYSPKNINLAFDYLTKYTAAPILHEVLIAWFKEVQSNYDMNSLQIFEQFYHDKYQTHASFLNEIVSMPMILHSPILIKALLAHKIAIPQKYLFSPYTSQENVTNIIKSYVSSASSNWPLLDKLYQQNQNFKNIIVEVILSTTVAPPINWAPRIFQYIQHRYPITLFTKLTPIDHFENIQKDWANFSAMLNQAQLLLPKELTWKSRKIKWSYLDAIVTHWQNLGYFSHTLTMPALQPSSIKLIETMAIEKESAWQALNATTYWHNFF